MSKKNLSAIADDSLDQLQVALEYMVQINSLVRANNSSLKCRHNNHAAQLASVFSYLVQSYRDSLSLEVKRLDGQLTAVDLRV